MRGTSAAVAASLSKLIRRTLADMARHGPHAKGMHEHDDDEHGPAEEEVGRRHHLGQLLEKRQLREVIRAAF